MCIDTNLSNNSNKNRELRLVTARKAGLKYFGITHQRVRDQEMELADYKQVLTNDTIFDSRLLKYLEHDVSEGDVATSNPSTLLIYQAYEDYFSLNNGVISVHTIDDLTADEFYCDDDDDSD